MKIKLTGLIIFAIWVFVALPATAQDKTPAKEAPPGKPAVKTKSKKSKEPIEITSERMRSENGGVKIVFSGNVVSYQGELKITSDIMEIYNTEDKKETEEIVAIGNVVITRCSKRAIGDRAVYLDKLQKIILTGAPHATAWEEDNMIEGRELIFLMEQDRFIANEKVRMKIYPKDEENDPKEKSPKKKSPPTDQPCSSK